MPPAFHSNRNLPRTPVMRTANAAGPGARSRVRRWSRSIWGFIWVVAALLAAASGWSQPARPPAGTGHAAPPAAAPGAVRQYTIEQFLATKVWGGDWFSPDGTRLLVNGNLTGVVNAYEIPVGGGEPVKLTDSKVSAVQVEGYFPSGDRFLYGSDRAGDEQTHLYARGADGSVRDLTPGDKLKAEFLEWAPDDRSFFFATNERDPHQFDAYEMAVDGYARTLLFRNEGKFQLGPISPDRRYVALVKNESTVDVDIYLHDRRSGEIKKLTPHGGEAANQPLTFSPDGAALYYASDEGSEFSRLMRYDLATGKHSEVLRPGWDVLGARFSRDGRYLAVSINNDARTETRLFETAGMRPLPLPQVPDADVTSVRFSRDGRRMAFYAESSRQPRNLFVADLPGGTPRQLTRALDPAIQPGDLVSAEVVRFRSYDGVEVPGLLYKPHGAGPEHKVAAIVSVHGGPGGQSRVGYGALTQYLVNHGYAVYAINNRGSSGYGRAFFKMADRKHGDADLGDCVASKKMLADTGWVDPGRMAILGGSYGGYMVLAALAFRPREFNAGVDLFGVANWPRTLASIPPYWASERKALYKMIGDPEVDGDYLRKISPLFHAEKIERPLLVLQGENDPRVLKRESDEIVAAARGRGTPVEYLIFPNEGHGFARKDSQERAYKAILDFLDKYLKPA
ncbi:MAG TPA: S9 family peptidase [Thermoanaerobaculia bacterium]|nr:S9 family peptidase [Thermoanaerobaculia bacterium]